MSISSFFRRAFSGDVDEPVEEFDDLDRGRQSTLPAHREAQSGGQTAIPADLADAILRVINAQLPAALVGCIDPEAQRRWLAAELGPALEEYAGQVSAVRREATSRREEQKAALLSEQRQRRALTDRNRDLESKIAELDSEIEQHKLTISSLMNKLRMADLGDGIPAETPKADETAARELEQLRATVAEQAARMETLTADLEQKSAQLEEQAGRLADADSKLRGADDIMAKADAIFADKEKEIERLNGRIAELESAAAAVENAEAPRKRRGRPRKQPRPEALDPADDSSAELEEVDWLLPGGVPAGHVGRVADPEFGYQPPKHVPEPDSDAQLTLF